MTGFNLPPGCTTRDIDLAYGADGPCLVCGQDIDDCICPECPVCKGVGDPWCYDGAHECTWCGVRSIGFSCDGTNNCPRQEADHYYRPSHGLIRSFAQVALRAEAEARWREETLEPDCECEWIQMGAFGYPDTSRCCLHRGADV